MALVNDSNAQRKILQMPLSRPPIGRRSSARAVAPFQRVRHQYLHDKLTRPVAANEIFKLGRGYGVGAPPLSPQREMAVQPLPQRALQEGQQGQPLPPRGRRG